MLHTRKSATKDTETRRRASATVATKAIVLLILRHVGVQRLKVLVSVMLARERRALADSEDGGCTELAAALATLPSGLLEMVADAVAALGHADV